MATNSPVAARTFSSPVLTVAQPYALEPVGADGLEDLAVPLEADLVVAERPLLHDLAGAQGVAAVDHRDAAGEAGEEGGLLDRGVAAADHDDVLVAEEEPVAGRAPRDAAAGQLGLAGDAEVAVGRAHREHDGLGVVGAGGGLHDLGVGGEVHLGDVVGDQLGAEALGLLAQVVHELRAHDAVREAGVVLDVGGVHQRAAGGDRALEHQRLQSRAGQVDRGGVAGRTGPHDDGVAHLLVAHGSASPRRHCSQGERPLPGASSLAPPGSHPRSPRDLPPHRAYGLVIVRRIRAVSSGGAA